MTGRSRPPASPARPGAGDAGGRLLPVIPALYLLALGLEGGIITMLYYFIIGNEWSDIAFHIFSYF